MGAGFRLRLPGQKKIQVILMIVYGCMIIYYPNGYDTIPYGIYRSEYNKTLIYIYNNGDVYIPWYRSLN